MVNNPAADPGAELRVRQHSTSREPASMWTHMCIMVRFILGAADAQMALVVAPGARAVWTAREAFVLHLSVGSHQLSVTK